VLNIGGMNDDVQQETQRVDQDVPLATLDLLARIVARRIDAKTLFFMRLSRSGCR
jgi:predicted lipid carrier protein YhbT